LFYLIYLPSRLFRRESLYSILLGTCVVSCFQIVIWYNHPSSFPMEYCECLIYLPSRLFRRESLYSIWLETYVVSCCQIVIWYNHPSSFPVEYCESLVQQCSIAEHYQVSGMITNVSLELNFWFQ
jgi:hypothetical protein